MTDITREQIEAFKGDAEYDLGVAETYNQPTEIEKAMKRIALCNMALGYLDVMPRPIEDAVIGERYVFFSGGEYRCVDYWVEDWRDHHKTWDAPFTNCIPLSVLPTQGGGE